MLDLSKPLGQAEGVVLYGDHEQLDLVYYLPDEIDLRELAAGSPDILLQIFFPDQAVSGVAANLENAVGSILSLGVQCRISPTRLDLVRAAAAARLGRDSIRLTLPVWQDGTVDLLLLDTKSGDTIASAVRDDQMVRGVVGSRKPSLSDGLLSGLFHARLDRRGTALVAAAIEGQAGSLAGVLYDLKFAALRPTVNLKMSADLNRCGDFFKVGAGVQVYYVAADISATFGKMREQGVIKVDLVSEAADPESERLVNESVKDFYDVLMRELFKPTVSPAEAIGAVGGAAGSVQTSIVKFSFAYTKVEHQRVVEVDYRKRSATIRTHNPQAHLARLAKLGGGAAKFVQRVPLSAAWREFEVEVAAPGAFEDSSLRQVRVVLWRGRDAVLAAKDARDGGLRMPASAVPIADVAFAKDDSKARRVAWVGQPDEAPFYRWQARLTFAPQDDTDSPAEIWSEPHVSSSTDLDLFPEILAPRRQTVLKLGVAAVEGLRLVEANLVARDAQAKKIGERRLSIDAAHPEARWSVRRSEAVRVEVQAGLVYRYEGGRSVTLPPQTVLDRDIVANDPFMKTLTIAPFVAGAPADVLEVAFIARYENTRTGFQSEAIRRLRPPDFRSDDVKVPVLGPRDSASWEAIAVRASGQQVPLGRGESSGGVVNLAFSPTRRIRVEWLGPTPADLAMRFLRATFRSRKDGADVGEGAVVEFRGTAVDGERLVTLSNEGRAEFSVEKRFEDGRKEMTGFVGIEGDLLVISG